jgi:hypothetical protein
VHLAGFGDARGIPVRTANQTACPVAFLLLSWPSS